MTRAPASDPFGAPSGSGERARIAAEQLPTVGQWPGDEFRIEYTITRRLRGEADFTEIGFGSSGAWSDVDQCAHILSSNVQNREWETEAGMPDPREATS